jgi:hypothetical protein
MVKKNVLWAVCGVAAVAMGFAVARRLRPATARTAGATRDDCIGQPARYTNLHKPRLRLRLQPRLRG